MAGEKISFTKEKETMLITLYSRALESQTQNPVLRDPWAEEAIRRIDYDFAHLKLAAVAPLSTAIRAKQFDLWTSAFLADHPDATVLHLGCGMDSRVFRVDPPASVHWFDVDYPEVIDLRKRLYPERDGYGLISTSLADLSWLDEIPKAYPAMIVAEGVMMYLTEDIVKPLLYRLTNYFPAGQVAFDSLSRFGSRMAGANPSVKATGATFSWGIDDPTDIKAFAPKMDLLIETHTPDLPGYSKLPWMMRAVVRVMEPITALRRLNRLLLYRF